MPDYSKNIVYLSQEQYQELITNETLTVNDQIITYNENDIYVTPQAEPITDVKINGTSIGSNGVANIPYATNNNLGLIQGAESKGITITNGSPFIRTAPDAVIKEGDYGYLPITPINQHKSIFYGLSKLAGVDLANETVTLGTYPDSSKAAIQNMLGITDLLSTEESSTATAAHVLNSTFMMDGKLHRATAAIAIGDAVEVGTNCEVVSISDAFAAKKDTVLETTLSIGRKDGTTIGQNSIALGYNTEASGYFSQALGVTTKASGYGSHAEGGNTIASSQFSHVEGESSIASGMDTHAEGFYTLASGKYSHAENYYTIAAGMRSHAEGSATQAIGIASHAEGRDSHANGNNSHAEGAFTIANAAAQHVFGKYNIEDTYTSWPEWIANTSYSIGDKVKVTTIVDNETTVTGYICKTANSDSEFTATNWTKDTYMNYAEIVGNGIDTSARSNARALTWTGDERLNGYLYVGCNADSTGGVRVPHDIQIDGISIVSNGIANIPVASNSVPGVVKVNDDGTYGIKMLNGQLAIKTPASTAIKNGNSGNQPLTPLNQHEATFYGLAKAAGDTTQSISTNAVGTYTDSAKIAIKNMLGVTQTLTVTVLTQDNVTVTGQTVTVRAVNATGHVFATAAYEGQPVSFAVPSGFAYYVSVSDTLAHHFNPTTASGVIIDADASVTLTYSDFSSIQTAADIKAALNAGLDLTDLVGEQISCIWNNSTLVWDVVDYSNDTITLLTHDTLPTQLVFEPVQALMWCENGLAAGSYSFIDGSSTYYFTLTTAIPSGGQLRATTSTFQTYASMEATATLETGTVSTTEISGATSLGTTASGNLNHMSRVNYGSNNYKESALFQWLNSTEAANIPMPRITKFSRPCTYSVPGFLGALDSSFVAAIDDTTWLCSTNNTYECPTSLGGTVAKSNAYTVTAKVGLASEMEIFGSYGGTADGSAVFDLFNGATADDRKKYQPGTSTARNWWLRSPHWYYAYGERGVGSSGAAGSSYAYNSSGVVPAVKISKTVVSE